jgi:hypothetical protein
MGTLLQSDMSQEEIVFQKLGIGKMKTKGGVLGEACFSEESWERRPFQRRPLRDVVMGTPL